ncbi:MAG: hypothetical protein J5449_10265, partial [Oscillospiraceae bacterium]|nr:hypothetical protein [Oscillospiraceae bacterium]
RLAHGKNPMSPDRGHIHHRLIDMGLSQKQAVAALYAVSSILGLSAVVLATSGAMRAMIFFVALAVVAFLASRVIFPREIAETRQAKVANGKPEFDVPLDDMPESETTADTGPELHPAVDADMHTLDESAGNDADSPESENGGE